MIGERLVHLDVVKEYFACELSACKGACCWEGDYGAPLETAELETLQAILPQIRSWLSPAGLEVLDREGPYVYLADEDQHATPLINNGPCAYMTYDAAGVAMCGIEQAYRAGVIDFPKPISCHLYPIRVYHNKGTGFEALNYDRWNICSAACRRGKKESIPLYQFAREAIIRKYGADFYEELAAAAQHLSEEG